MTSFTSRLIRLSLFISIASCSGFTFADVSEQAEALKRSIAEKGLEAVLLDLVSVWNAKLPIVDQGSYGDGATWTAQKGVAWGDSIHWFIHSDSNEPNSEEFRRVKSEMHCVEYEGIYTKNGVRLRYHLFNSEEIPIGGITLDNKACEEYIASK